MNWLKRTTDFFSPRVPSESEVQRKVTLLIHCGFIIITITLVYLPIYYSIGYMWGVFICLGGGISMLILVGFSRYWKSFNLISNIAFLIANLFFLSFALTSGGISSPLSAWLISIPLVAFLVLNKRSGFFWAMICGLEIIGLFLFEIYEFPFPVLYDDKWSKIIHFVDFLGLALFMIALILVYLDGREFAIRELKRATDKISIKNIELRRQKGVIEEINQELENQRNLLAVQNNEIKVMNQKLENVVNERTQHLIRANEELDLFLYRASHDLRRPVMSLLGLFELARLEFGKPAGYELLNHMNSTAGNMDKMLRKLIMISEVNHEYTHPVEINLLVLLDKVLQVFAKSIEEYKIKLIKTVYAPIDIYSVQILLEIIVFNLIENAIYFHNPEAEAKPFIDVYLKTTDNELIIEVKDNGLGIEEEHLSRVFRMFYRGTQASAGNGLGLYIVKKAVERLEGTIDLQSEVDKGTSIKVSLPIKTIKNLQMNVIL